MRPVERGGEPLDSEGNPKQFNHYQNARKDLIERLGGYCSYCEMKLDSHLAVEHIQPKEHHDHLALSWSNFLLACTNCNSTKLNKNPIPESCLWPHKDNTSRAFSYSEDGIVRPAPQLSDNLTEKAKATVKLVGLDKTPDNLNNSDRRWRMRMEAWQIAQRAKDRLNRNDNEDMREQITETASGHAYWSIWMTIFADDTDMRNRLIQALPGTATNCFNPNGNPVQRLNGQL